MTLRTLMESGVHFEGYIKIQCWETEDNPSIYCEGYNNELDIPENIMNKDISYIFPYTENDTTPGICIELAEE